MELLIKLTALSLCVSAVTALLKKSDEALSLLLLLAAVLVGCAMLLPALSELFDFCERALSLMDLPLTLFVPVVKVTAIALVARFSCALCADAGQSALSSLLAAAGTLCALVCALPLMEALLEMVEGFLWKKLLCLLFAAFLLCVSASALELPSGLDDVVPRELIDSAEAGDDLLLRGGQYLFSHFRAALQDAVANSLRGAMALMLLSILCGLVESTAESAGETPTRYAGYLGVLGAAALSAGDLSALIGLGVETMDELSTMAKLLLPTIAAAMAGGGCVGSASVWQVGALMLSDIFLSLMRDVLVPVLYCMIGTAAAGALLEQSRLSLLSKGIGKLLSWGLSAILIVFTAFLSVSNLLAGSADRFAVKVGKTVISGAVPVVGGILSDATEAVAAAALTLRGTLGVLGVFSVLALCLVPLLRMAVQYLFYQLAAFFSGMVGSQSLSKFLEQLSSAFSLMLAMTAGGAFLLLVSLLIAMMMVVTV